ncbi:MAG: tryptophan synthase subunit alpha [Verrucomicrobiota bacterium]
MKQLIPLEWEGLLNQFRRSRMNRIDATFQRLKEENQSAFIAYVCAGDPSLAATKEIAASLDLAGVDVLELGVPFSDPMADGAVNQMAAERALAGGASVRGVFELIAEIRQTSDTPIVLYSYLNPIYTYGFETFLRDAKQAGVDGLLLLDLPPDEQLASEEFSSTGDLHHIRLIAPTTTEERVRSLAKMGEGFIYYVSREGVTGERQDVAAGLAERVSFLQESSPVPVVVGFGISTPAQAEEVARSADGVVVGSAIVKTIAQQASQADLAAKVGDVVKPLVEATKRARVA